MDCDLKLAGGTVVDGSGAPARRADVAINGERITAVGDLDGLAAARTVDCSGKTITPGFIDIHSHSDWLLPGADHGALVEPFVRQGMTTLVGGNCGFSPAPISAHNRGAAHDASRLIVDEAIDLAWTSMGDFLDRLEESGVALNCAELVGHGAVRAAVTGPLNPAPPTADELRAMEGLVRDALAAGCVGVSTGLGYPPGIFAHEDELAHFAGWAAREGKLFTSHLKAYSWMSGALATDPMSEPHNLAALDEILRVGERSGARVQVSHLIFVGRQTWPSYPQALARIDAARRRGVDVACDAFPYTAGNTTASVIFPAHVVPRLEAVLADADELASLRSFATFAFEALGFGLPDIQIMRANAPALNQYDGLRITEAAARADMEPFDFYCRLVLESGRQARVLIHTYSGDGGEEEALRAVLAHPQCTIETDTFVTREGHQNPASYGTFPRVLSTYVKEGLFSFAEAVRKMTGAAAERLGWKDRGWVRPGCAADLVVLDTATLQDTATFDAPARFPRGIERVLINGRTVLEDGRYDAGARAGRVLR
ncbi:MAG: amidohydrolase family protein [Myxococcales bacterium]|jgi:N-acyl-D-aspartate/D-glutamate deacylase|nr:amidohydrolase family protein [Myxococcales bacterium]